MNAKEPNRLIGRFRTWDLEAQQFREWINVPEKGEEVIPQTTWSTSVSGVKVVQIKLKRGSVLKFFPALVPPGDLPALQKTMATCQLYRQYALRGGIKEPRVHVLLSSDARKSKLGYRYHCVKMRAQPLDLVPSFQALSTKFARMMSLPDGKWNIGVDLIVYRDGNDSMGFHSDDNQGETSVLALVVECKEARPVYIRPHRNVARAEGDEEVQLFVRQGDAYELDAGCQAGYEHSLPKRAQSKERRMVAIFKQGIPTTVDEDSGVCVVESTNASINRYPWLKKKVDPLKPANRRAPVTFGHISGFPEGCIASRMKLYLGRMCNDQRGVNGNVTLGVDALVFSRNDFTLGEKDGFYWLCYTCKRSEGGGGLTLSYLTGKPVRVLRSSNLKMSQFAPLKKDDAKSIAACYRYDGLYTIIKVYDTEGRATQEAPGPKSGDKHPQFTYVLQRNPTVEEVYEYEFTVNEPYQLGEFAYFFSGESANCNVKSATELWNEIQISGGVSELQDIPRKIYGPDWE